MVLEKEIYPQIESYLENEGFDYFREVQFLNRHIDLVCVNGEKIIAIEVKIKDWKRALQQALTCRLCVHEVYVAMWHEFAHRVPVELFGEYGIGLMSVDGTVNMVKKAGKSSIIHSSMLTKLLTTVKEGSNGNKKFL